ncbi:hypothetical protein N657DRAFT_680637 [Parathielavia appendiculata]|uniref:Exonuclease domain-containing protein n=1 Tax=Parathielavia appendiculata TaxID=2587402 RepID=A0AAN6Z4I8_9PEZI|nr:hypothetical protein N657DRAFT_680637 [Parathielavia appendiculata]
MAQDAASTPENGTRAIALNSETFQQLNSLVASPEALKLAGYIVKPLTDDELEQKKRCLTCGDRISKKRPQGQQHRPQRDEAGQQPRTKSSDSPASGEGNPRNADSPRPKSRLLCNFHPGNVINKTWTCCGKHVTAAPCTGKEDHDAPVSDDLVRLELQRRWQFHPTAPEAEPNHRAAVAIDCEMGTAFDGDSELIRLTVIDYFTGEALIDSLVYPDIAMQHFNTRWSGVTRGDMERSRRQHKCIMGRDAARRALFDYVGPSTIVVGHSAQNDLSSLRWIHHRVVDSYMVESAMRKEVMLKAGQEKKGEEVDKPNEGGPKDAKKRGKGHPDGMSLKALVMKRLGRAIQVGKKGHDSLEDALAARDLIHAHIMGLGSSDV